PWPRCGSVHRRSAWQSPARRVAFARVAHRPLRHDHGCTTTTVSKGGSAMATTANQVAIVTGAASGIGRAMTLGLLDAGIEAAAVDREPAWLDELRATGGQRRGRLHTLREDLSDPSSFDRIVSGVMGAAGRIDILVNNAGIGQGSIKADQRHNPLRFWETTP